MSYVIAIKHNNIKIYSLIKISFNIYYYSQDEIDTIVDIINKYKDKGIYKLKDNDLYNNFYKFCNCKDIIYINNINDIQLFNQYFYLGL